MAQPRHLEEANMTSSSETGQVTGTKDKDYNIIWFTEACLSNALRLETYIQDAERDGDTELAGFFRKAQAESRKGRRAGQAAAASAVGELATPFDSVLVARPQDGGQSDSVAYQFDGPTLP